MSSAVPSDGAVPLSILDLAPVPAGGGPADAVRDTIDLARRAEDLGYARYWLAEHHFASGVASAAPAVLIALVAAATRRIRVGSGAVQLGHQTAAAVVEQFGTLDAAFPGRIDLGMGRSGQRRAEAVRSASAPHSASADSGAVSGSDAVSGADRKRGRTEAPSSRTVDGLLIPAPFAPGPLLASPRLAAQAKLLRQPGAETPAYPAQVAEILALLDGTYVTGDGQDVHATPGEGAELEPWVLGSSGGESATVAAVNGLPFAANYHVSPATVLEAVEAYRERFVPAPGRPHPHVMVSADVLVAPDDETAWELAAPYALWVRDIRGGRGATPYRSPDEALAHAWTEDERGLVADRVATQFAGSPETVVERLDTLRRVTGADELLVTTITYDHADRVRSFELLAKAWADH